MRIVEPQPLDLARILGFKDGKLAWGGSNFQKTLDGHSITGEAPANKIRGLGLHGVELHAGQTPTEANTVFLSERLQLDEKLNAVRVVMPIIVHVPNAAAMKLLEGPTPPPLARVDLPSTGDKKSHMITPQRGSARGAAKVTTYVKPWEAHLKKWHSKHGAVTVGEGKAGFDITSNHAFVGIHAIAAKSEYGPFEVTFGAGSELGVGIKDDSLDVEAGEIGITIGRKCGIHIFGDVGFSIDFGKIFHWPGS